MKKYLSVVMPAARATFYKLIAILVAMAALECGLVWYESKHIKPGGGTLTDITAHMHFGLVFFVAFVLLSIVVIIYSNKGVQYTLGRLSIDERAITLVWGGYYGLCFFILWAFQAALAYTILSLCAKALPAENLTGQSVFFAFYNDTFLHGILPLGDVYRYFTNICFCLSLGVTSACFSCRRRHGQTGIAFIIVAVFAVIFFRRAVVSFNVDIIVGVFMLACAAVAAVKMWRGMQYED